MIYPIPRNPENVEKRIVQRKEKKRKRERVNEGAREKNGKEIMYNG